MKDAPTILVRIREPERSVMEMIAQARGRDFSDVLGDALALAQAAALIEEAGGHLVLEHQDGRRILLEWPNRHNEGTFSLHEEQRHN